MTTIHFACSDDLKRRAEEAAAESGLQLSDFMRALLDLSVMHSHDLLDVHLKEFSQLTEQVQKAQQLVAEQREIYNRLRNVYVDLRSMNETRRLMG